ncbi:serine hydrolase domain-containing protein [Nocardia sp. NPDC127526]|uniref:serine hydrolase domain-containing protein n=1 Tax=Nocardia sp. NPDC127526 TaxID=3345393 RepID=UPI0036391379
MRTEGGRAIYHSSRLFIVGAAGVLLAAFLAGCGNSAETRAFPADAAATIDRIVESGMTAALIPGAMVAVVDPDRGTYVKAYGTSDLATGRPADIHDSVRIASVTKTFTSTAVLRLADEGKLSLDDRLNRYVDGIPYGDTITLRDLLGMRGGVYDLDHEPAYQEQLDAKSPTLGWHEGDRLRAITGNPQYATPPNTRTAYSNSEYYLLGLVLEKVTGKPVHEVINDLVADYGLTETTYPVDATMPTPESRGYAYFDETPTDVTARDTPTLYGAGASMVSTISDLAEYTGMLGRGNLLKPETLHARTQSTQARGGLSYGLGVMVSGRWFGHSGTTSGYTTYIAYLPDRDVSVAVAVNQFTRLLWLRADDIWKEIVTELYPGTLGDTPAPSTAPPVPAVDELDAQLRQSLDPAIPAAAKPLRVENDDKDPDLITRLSTVLAQYDPKFQVYRATAVNNSLMALGLAAAPEGKSQMVVPFAAVDGAWRISSGWACNILTASAVPSPACT